MIRPAVVEYDVQYESSPNVRGGSAASVPVLVYATDGETATVELLDEVLGEECQGSVDPFRTRNGIGKGSVVKVPLTSVRFR